MNDIFLTGIIAALSSFVSYIFGKRAKVNEIVLNKGFPVAEEIAVLFQNIVERDLRYYDFYAENFGHYKTLEEAIADAFEKLPSLYEKEYERINIHRKQMEELNNKLKIARLYLKPRVINNIQKYIDLGLFSYLTDGGIFHDTFYIEFFRNITNQTIYMERRRLSKKIQNYLNQMINL